MVFGKEYASRPGHLAEMVETFALMISGVAQRAEAEQVPAVALTARDAQVALEALLDVLAGPAHKKLTKTD